MELEGEPPGPTAPNLLTGKEVTDDVNSIATDDGGRFNPTGSLQFDIVGHESNSMTLKHNKRIGT